MHHSESNILSIYLLIKLNRHQNTINIFRNGLGDDSFFTWPDGKIPFIIGDGFNSSNKQNILDSVDYYNNLFGDCIKWVPRSDEVKHLEYDYR